MNEIATPARRAEAEQRAASDPSVSAFVDANAGSGKTKLLTDRLLRLMLGTPDQPGRPGLAPADPARIQCLTFTKAAAAEMSLRLQTRLGSWVTLDDAALDRELRGLDVPPDEDMRGRARGLFARVLDLPGGMRIGTIHAFCQSLLRRFPLEAELSPHFRLVDESDARSDLTAAREGLLGAPDPDTRATVEGALGTLAGLASADGFGGLVAGLEAERERLRAAFTLRPEELEAAGRRAAGVHAPDEATLLAHAVLWPEEPDVLRALQAVARDGSPAIRTKAERMLDWMGLDADTRAEHWEAWREEFIAASGPRAAGAFANKKLAETRPDIVDALLAERDRVAAVEDDRRALRAAAASTALLLLASPVLTELRRQRERGGRLDYDDLITRSSRLLVKPGAEWVLFKLDGGLDHLLLDEVQDTAPEQWRIALAMTEEFFAGLGARGDAHRTFFAVGDPKQSIYSFQGADPDAFDASRARLRSRVRRAGQEWRDVTLDVSFRSTAPVLDLVDAVFRDPAARRGVAADDRGLRHVPFRAGHAGRVELWPLAPLAEEPERQPWTVPERNLGLTSAPGRLADALAGWIAAQTGHDEAAAPVLLESRGRPLRPGDILVLVRRRGDFPRALVRALKARGVPVAGLDRLMLTDQPAVQDLMALLEALILPEDDLSLACTLTSPLGGLSDDSLMALAIRRTGSLWATLRARHAEREDWGAAWAFLAALYRRADFTTPHALLAEALGPLGGRARLFTRLGPEAAEPVDEMLGAALAYARAHPPSLQGFLHWLRNAAAEVKREAEGGGGAVRIMTVHGAKGLQAPVVVLPDTTALPPEDGPFVWVTDAQSGAELPLWTPRKEYSCNAARAVRDAGRARRMEEYNRLLYVALTRAEDRLVVCGWQTRKGVPDGCWYTLVERGFRALDDAAEEPFAGPWPGTVLAWGTPQSDPVAAPAGAADSPADAALPAWLSGPPHWRPAPPPAEPSLPRPLAPSRPEGVDFGLVPRALSPLDARPDHQRRFLRGRLVHALLCHLPDLPEAQRHEAAHRYASRADHGLPRDQAAALAEEALAVLRHPALAALFGPAGRGELALTGVVNGRVVVGTADRVAVLPDAVWVADYKTNREPPARVEETPRAYLVQMAAYRGVLRSLYPGRPIRCALVWTVGAQVALLPDPLLDAHAPGPGFAAPDADLSGAPETEPTPGQA